MLSFPKQYINRINSVKEQQRANKSKELDNLRQFEQMNKQKQKAKDQTPDTLGKQVEKAKQKPKDLSVGKQKTCPNPVQTGAMIEAFESEEESQQEQIQDYGSMDANQKQKMRKKHVRRTAKEIERSFVCPYSTCSKVYGSEGSLNLHIKIKHNGGNKTDREKLAKNLIIAHDKGQLQKEIESIDLNLPPGTLQKAALKIGLDNKVSEDEVLKLIYDKMKLKQEEAIARLQDGESCAQSGRNSIEPLQMFAKARVQINDNDVILSQGSAASNKLLSDCSLSEQQ